MRAFVLGLFLCSCTGPPAADDSDSRLRSAFRHDSGPISRLTNRENGLELRKWLVADDAESVARAIEQHAESEALPPEAAAQMRRNGLRLVRLPVTQVDALLGALGGSTVEVNGWHGQMPSWGVLHELGLGSGRALFAVDGRMVEHEGGKLQLLGRSWTMLMEDGPLLQLEITPAYAPPPAPLDLRHLLGAPVSSARAYTTLRSELQLDPDFAYALTCEAPGTEWHLGTAGGTPEASSGRQSAETSGVGPSVEAPRTIGQLMLATEGHRPLRGILVFIPRIPPTLQPVAIGASGREAARARAPDR